jgi:hypothetical protein
VVVSFVVVAVAGGDVGDCGCDYTIDCAVPFPPLSFFPVCVAPSFVRSFVQIYPLCWFPITQLPVPNTLKSVSHQRKSFPRRPVP